MSGYDSHGNGYLNPEAYQVKSDEPADVQQWWLGEIEAEFGKPDTETFSHWEAELEDNPVIDELIGLYATNVFNGDRRQCLRVTHEAWTELFLATQSPTFLDEWKTDLSYYMADELANEDRVKQTKQERVLK